MALPSWLESYVGLNFKSHGRTIDEGVDCYGLVRLIFAERFGTLLPRFLEETEKERSPVKLEPADKPGKAALIFIRDRGAPHIGFVIDGQHMIHTTPKTGSVVERYNSPKYRHKIEAIYNVEPRRI